MAYLNTHTRTTKPTSNDLMQTAGRMPSLFGVHVGFVKDAADVQKNGRIRVWVPELGSEPNNQEGWIIANYCSPFAGATNIETTNTTDVKQFEGTQTSYGMWMVPPDINNQVLIMFINGDPSRGIWIGCLYNQFMNNMVPGTASDTNNYQYPGKDIPVAEYNKNDTRVSLPQQATHPYEATKFRGLGNQGLINDPQRGVTKSSARRESPSQVFGILTPGPAIDPTVAPDKIRRKGGSAFIMDDKTGSEYIQLTTKSGAQININETTGFVYLINRDGTAWVQMDAEGNVDIFGAKNISMRAQRDFNIRADRNINIEAGQNIFMKAAKDTKQDTTSFTYNVNNTPKSSNIPVWNYVGEGKGQGGNIVMQALNNWQSTTQKGAFLTVVENNMNVKIGNALVVTTLNGGQDFNAAKAIKMTTRGTVDINAVGNIRVTSDGSISVIAQKDIIQCTAASINFKAADNILGAAANDILLTSTNLDVNAAADILLTSANLGITAASLFKGNVGITGNIKASAKVDIMGNITAGAKVDITGDINAGAKVAIKGNITTGANVDITGNVNIGGNLGVVATDGTGISISNGTIGIFSPVEITGNLKIYSDLHVVNDISVEGSVNVTKDITAGLSVTSPDIITGPAGNITPISPPGPVVPADPPEIIEPSEPVLPELPAIANEAHPALAERAVISNKAQPAEVKPLNDKINILAGWKATITYFPWDVSTFYNPGNIVKYNGILYIANKASPASAQFDTSAWTVYVPEDKFKRNSESIRTTVSVLPTYEPCPEHAAFTTASVAGYTPIITPDDKTYEGSGSAAGPAVAQPAPAVNPGANNTSVQADPNTDSSISKDINMNALRCQLSIHEGVKNKAYADTKNLITGGIGHLMRANELPLYPLGTPISDDQIETWYVQDASSAIKIAQQLFPNSWGDFTDIRKRAVTDLAYNLGKGGLSKFVKFISAMNVHNYDKAGSELKDSSWFNQVGRRGPNVITMIVKNIDPNGCDKKYPE